MAYEVPVLTLPGFLADADLSAKQFVGVVRTATGVAVAPANGIILGVLQNDPVEGAPAAVMAYGVTKMVAGAAMATSGVAVMVDATGRAIPQTGSNAVVGILLDTATGAGVLCTVLLTP